MKSKKAISILILIVMVVILLVYGAINSNKTKQSDGKIRILTSFYPIYIMTLNITNGVDNVEVSNMADKLNGCIHDYTLTTTDLKKIETANIFIENGAGLESFTDKIVNSYKDLKVIYAAQNVTNFIYSDDNESNSHIWLSIENYKNEVQTIASKLSEIDEANSGLYNANANQYIEKLNELQSKFKQLDLSNKKAICLDESLEYLLKGNNIDETLIETDHDQASISAELIKETISKMNSEGIKAIFIDKNDSDKLAKALQNETSAKIYVLNSGMNGEKNLNSYIDLMNQNYEILKDLQ